MKSIALVILLMLAPFSEALSAQQTIIGTLEKSAYLRPGEMIPVKAVSSAYIFEGEAAGDLATKKVHIRLTSRISKDGKHKKIRAIAIDDKGYVGVPADVWLRYDNILKRSTFNLNDAIISLDQNKKFTILDVPEER